MTQKRFQWVFIKDNELEFQDNGIVKRFNNYRLEEFLNELQMKYDAQRELYAQLDCVKNRLYVENKELKLQYKELEISLLNNQLAYNDLEKENKYLKEEKHDWLQQKARYEQQYTEYIKENKNLKAQLYCDEDGICNQCKYHYLVKNEDSELGYYNSRCRKGHYECARVSLRYCEDFEIKNGE